VGCQAREVFYRERSMERRSERAAKKLTLFYEIEAFLPVLGVVTMGFYAGGANKILAVKGHIGHDRQS